MKHAELKQDQNFKSYILAISIKQEVAFARPVSQLRFFHQRCTFEFRCRLRKVSISPRFCILHGFPLCHGDFLVATSRATGVSAKPSRYRFRVGRVRFLEGDFFCGSVGRESALRDHRWSRCPQPCAFFAPRHTNAPNRLE